MNNTLELILRVRDKASSQLSRFSKNIEGTSAKMKKLGASMVAIGAVPTVALIGAVKAGVAFDKQLRNIQSISKDTDATIQKMGDQFIQLSKKLPQSATTLAEGFYNIQSSGFAGAEAMKILQASAESASAGLTNTETSATAITGALNAFGLSADKANYISNILFKTVDVGVVTFEELASGIGNTYGSAKNMGVSMEELGASISTMTKKGINSSEAMTSLNGVMMGMLKPTTELQTAYKSLGFANGQAMIKSLGLGGSLQKLTEYSKKSGVGVQDLFGNIRGLKGVLAITGDDLKSYNADLEKMQHASDGAGATAEALAQQQKSADYQIKLFKNNLEDLGLTLSKTILPTMNKVIKKVTDLVDKFSKFSDKHPQLVSNLLLLGGAIGVIGGALVVLGSVLPNIVKSFETLKDVAVGAFEIITGLSLPILALIAILVGLTIVIVQNKEKVKELVFKMAQSFYWLKSQWKQILHDIWLNFMNWINRLHIKAVNFGKNIGKTFRNMGTNIKKSFNDMIDSANKRMYAWLDKLLNKVTDFKNKIVNKFTAMANGITNALKNIKTPHFNLGEGSKEILGQQIKYPKLNVDWYEKGGWVNKTGLAVVHQGEYVLSKDMLKGNTQPEVSTGQRPITINAVVNNNVDLAELADALGYELALRGY